MKAPWEPGLYGNRVVFTGIETALIIGAVAIAAVGTVVAISAAQQRARAESDAANYNAQLADRNAVIAEGQGRADAELQQREARRRLAAAEAQYGASGLTLEGTPLDVLASSASDAELDKQTILYKSRLRALGYRDEADLDRYRASSAESVGRSSAVAAGLNGAGRIAMAGSGLLSSGGSAASSGLRPGEGGAAASGINYP